MAIDAIRPVNRVSIIASAVALPEEEAALIAGVRPLRRQPNNQSRSGKESRVASESRSWMADVELDLSPEAKSLLGEPKGGVYRPYNPGERADYRA